jgi:hypothetical protein
MPPHNGDNVHKVWAAHAAMVAICAHANTELAVKPATTNIGGLS